MKNVQLFLAFPISLFEITRKDGQYGRISKHSIYMHTPDIPQIVMRSCVNNSRIVVRMLLRSTESPCSGEDSIEEHKSTRDHSMVTIPHIYQFWTLVHHYIIQACKKYAKSD